MSTISLKLGEKNSFPYHGSGRVRGRADNSPVKTAAVLTCMAEPQPPDAFRPSYCDTENRIYLARELRRDLLSNLPRPSKQIMLRTGPSDLAFWVRVFQRPWVNTGFFGFEQPMENMPHYEQWVGQALVMRMLRAEKHWNHDAFFDYVDRWMTEEDDEAHRAVIARYARDANYKIRLGEDAWWTHQGNPWEPFVKMMWDEYRNNLPTGQF